MTTTDMHPVGARIREARRAKGLRRETLAHESGIAYGTIVNIEQGRHDPRVGTLIKLARILGVSTDELLGISKGPLIPTAA